MKTLKTLLLAIVIITSYSTNAQVAINTDGSNANANSMLDIKASDKGVLVPRVALIGIENPVSGTKPEGLLVWNTSTTVDYIPGFYYWSGTDWVSLASHIRTNDNGDAAIGMPPILPVNYKFQVYYDLSNDDLDNDGDYIYDESDEGFYGFMAKQYSNNNGYCTARFGFGTDNPSAIVEINPHLTYPTGAYVESHTNLLISTTSFNPFSNLTVEDWYGIYIKKPDQNIYNNKYAFISEEDAGDVGIGVTNPQRKLHVKDVMRLEPRNSAPSSPSAGDLYFDSSTSKLRCYDGSQWQDCW